MENILQLIVLQEVIHDENNIQIVGNIGIELAEPINIDAEERRIIPKNQDYYEETIQQYMGDLFIEHFRMSRETFENLLLTLGNVEPNAVHIIPPEKKVLFTIWILAKPESFLAAGDRFGLARSTAHMVFTQIINIIVQIIPQFIRWPTNHQETINVFHERSAGFPGVVGAIDGSHIPIKQPQNNANDYYNRKDFHSIILQGVCDHQMKFLDIFVGVPGRVHDARVFRLSDIHRKLTNNNRPLLPEEFHLIGDSAYPILKNLLTPYRDNGHLNEVQINYNNKLSGIRSIIERAFGKLKGKFRRLKYLDIGDPNFGTQIIGAACVLDNFIIVNDDDEDELLEVDNQIEIENAVNVDNFNMGHLNRNEIANLLFNN